VQLFTQWNIFDLSEQIRSIDKRDSLLNPDRLRRPLRRYNITSHAEGGPPNLVEDELYKLLTMLRSELKEYCQSCDIQLVPSLGVYRTSADVEMNRLAYPRTGANGAPCSRY
jgi:hypothetical protein